MDEIPTSMNGLLPLLGTAGDRECGCTCPHCGTGIGLAQAIAVCRRCGTVHHRSCWEGRGDCGAYSCVPARVTIPADKNGVLRITAEEVQKAAPLPGRRSWVPVIPPEVSRFDRLAIASLVTALVGIPIFGALTGLVAILLGCLALGSLRVSRQRGTGLAVAGVLLGLVDVVGWLIFLVMMLSRPQAVVNMEDLRADPAMLENLDPVLSRGLRANVLIEVGQGLKHGGGTVIGSGVIMRLSGGEALIVTNRHVVDADYNGSGPAEGRLDQLPSVQVQFISGAARAGQVVWLAPHGIDLALVRVPSEEDQAQAALWQAGRSIRVGDAVFAIGNPHNLGWTQTQGSVSQLRLQDCQGYQVHVIQTQTALNPGNSGGGLYDRQSGELVGINTWTHDKRSSEGLNFAIALETLLELKPPDLKSAGAAQAGEK